MKKVVHPLQTKDKDARRTCLLGSSSVRQTNQIVCSSSSISSDRDALLATRTRRAARTYVAAAQTSETLSAPRGLSLGKWCGYDMILARNSRRVLVILVKNNRKARRRRIRHMRRDPPAAALAGARSSARRGQDEPPRSTLARLGFVAFVRWTRVKESVVVQARLEG